MRVVKHLLNLLTSSHAGWWGVGLCYLWLISWFHADIAALGDLAVSISLLIPFVGLLAYGIYQRRTKQKSKLKPLFSKHSTLPPHLINPLQHVMPVTHHCLLNELFIPHLELIYEALSAVKTTKRQDERTEHSLFQQKLEVIVKVLTLLQQDERFITLSLSTMRTLMIVCFYRVLFRDLITQLKGHDAERYAALDEQQLFKQLPYRLFVCLGEQYWRAYEFYNLIMRDITEFKAETIVLNRDMLALLIDACKPFELICADNKANKHVDAGDVANNVLEAESLEARDRASLTELFDEAAPTVRQTENKASLTMTTAPKAVVATEVAEDTPHSHTLPSVTKVARDFIDWLQAKLDLPGTRYCINQGAYVFTALTTLGSEVVFVTDALFSKYHNMRGVSMDDVKAALCQSQYTDGWCYRVTTQDAHYITLRIEGIRIQQEELEMVTIEEEKAHVT